MTVDGQKLRELIARPVRAAAPEEVRRVGSVFFVGGLLPPRETLEALFDSHCQSPAELFHLSFGDLDSFHLGEELARQIKKNFNARLVGRIDFPAPLYIIERAYAAGVDVLDMPLHLFDYALSRERRLAREARLEALVSALTVFPGWGVASTLLAGEEPSCSTCSGIDTLLAAGIVPLVEIMPRAAHYPVEELAATFGHLAEGWKKHKVAIKPLQALIGIMTPLAHAKPKGLIRGFIDKVHDRQMLATSDLRRSLRVKQIEESFESAGL